MLKIKNLKVKVEDEQILKGVDFEVQEGQVNALMGQNGSGKSTLAQTLMGNPSYEVLEGEVVFKGENILDLSPDERSSKGIYLSFQHPSEIPGVKVYSYLRMIYNKSHEKNLSPKKFREFLAIKMDLLNLDESFTSRFLNEGFSGGEKKRMEMLQMLVLEPEISILDEVDSGLDVDAIKIVAAAVNYLIQENEMSVLLITHYSRILNYIKPNVVNIMVDGKIVKTGSAELADEVEKTGYEQFQK